MDARKSPQFSSANVAQQSNQINILQQQQQAQQQQVQHSNLVLRQTQSGNNFPPNQSMPSKHLQQQQQQQSQPQQLHIQIQQPETQSKHNGIDRLLRRMNHYRQHHTDCGPRFDQSFTGACEQQNIETTVLQKRFLENKAKKAAKKADKKQPDTILTGNLQSNVHVQQKNLKRSADASDSNCDGYEPLHKVPHSTGDDLKFSVEIVQQLEFTSSSTSSQPQQISTNVTVKALTNKNDVVSPCASNNHPNSRSSPDCSCNDSNIKKNRLSHMSPVPHQSHDVSNNLVQCKQEPDHEFVDLEQCAAALEKDAAANGHFPGLSDLIGNDTNEGNDTFKELIYDLNDFQSDFLDFQEKTTMDIKTEDGCKPTNLLSNLDNINVRRTNLMGQFKQQTFSENQINNINIKQPTRNAYINSSNGSNNTPMCDLSPAQTLKHMAEQHQHKNAMGMPFARSTIPNNVVQKQVISNRNGAFNNEFNKFNNNEFINNPNNTVQFNKVATGPCGSGGGGSPFDMNKSDMMYGQQSHSDFDMKRMSQSQMPKTSKLNSNIFNKQHYPTYGSPTSMQTNVSNVSITGSPGPPPSSRLSANGSKNNPNMGDGSGINNGNTNNNENRNNPSAITLQMKQSQQMSINQHSPSGRVVHVSAGQHLHLSGDVKSNLSVSAQQAMSFGQQNANKSQPGMNTGVGCTNESKNIAGNQQGPHRMNNPTNLSSESYTVSQSQSIHFTQQRMRHPSQQKHSKRDHSDQEHTHGADQSNISNEMLQTMNSKINMPLNIQSQNSTGNPNTNCLSIGSQNVNMSNVQSMAQNAATKHLMQQQNLCAQNSNAINQMSQIIRNNAASGNMNNLVQNPSNMLNNFVDPVNVKMNGMINNMNSIGGLRPDQSNFLQQQQQQQQQQQIEQKQMQSTKSMHMVGRGQPLPEYKSNSDRMLTNQMLHQDGGRDFLNNPPTNIQLQRIGQQCMQPLGMLYIECEKGE